MADFAVAALLIKQTTAGFNYQLMLNVRAADDRQAARAAFAIEVKDAWPEHGLQEVLATEIAPTQGDQS